MSGIAAIIRLDGGTVEPGQIEAMTAEMAYRGPDGISHWHGGAAAMGHLMMHTTPESLEERQPLTSADESLVLVFDGWLSNWEELRADLLSRGARLRSRSDAELILHAYETWGEDCPLHIDGEYAFVVWDARRQAAFCARDHDGLKPLHYHFDGSRLIVASDHGAILAVPGVPQVPNPGMIAEIMANEWITRDETVWQGIKRLLPAHWARFDRQGQRLNRYWQPQLEVTIRYNRDEDYADHYRSLFTEAVRRSSRSHLPVGCEVSGGLDSSAVFCLAHDLQTKGTLPAPSLKGFTYVFEKTPENIEADELDYVHVIARHTGVPVREVSPFLADLDWYRDRGRLDRDMAPYPNSSMAVNIGQALREEGGCVMLNGEGGDEWQGGRPFYYSEHLQERDWRQLWRSLSEDRAELGLRETAFRAFRFGLPTFIPRALLDWRRKRITPRGPNEFDGAYWFAPQLDELLAKRRQTFDLKSFQAIPNLARRAMLMNLTEPFCELARVQMSRQCARVGYETRSPMQARSLIEFAFATPERIRRRADRRKVTHSLAMQGLLPPMVASRQSKADFSIAFIRQLDHMRGYFQEELFQNGSSWLDRNGLKRFYDFYCKCEDKPIWELWGMFACAELFGVAD